MTIALESMAVVMPEVEGHPNRTGFRGVLTVVDAPSQRAPSGSKGHRVVLTRGAAEAALPSLLGMALDFVPSFDRHDQRRKVGVITSAEIVGRSLEVSGFLYAKDFPDVVEEIAKAGRRVARTTDSTRPGTTMQSAAELPTGDVWRREGVRLRASLAAAVEGIRRLTSTVRKTSGEDRSGALNAEAGPAIGAGLGMSYEVADVLLADKRARVWVLTKVTFTGAAILRRDKAAYADTWIELS